MPSPLHVLVLMDRDADAGSVLEELRQSGFEPRWLRVDTEAAYVKALHEGLDLVLADLRLVGFDALRAARRLRAARLDVPLIIVSGTMGEEQMASLIEEGVTDYVPEDARARLGWAVRAARDARRSRSRRRRDGEALKLAEAALATYAERLEILHEIDAAIIAADAPVAIAEAVLQRLRDLLGVPRAIVNMFDLAAGEVEWLAAVGRRRAHLGPGVRFSLTLMGDVEALRRGELQVVDTATLPGGPEVDALLASGVHAYVVVPMIAGGELIGGLSFGGAPGEFSPEQIGIAKEVAATLAIAIAHARLHERVQSQADVLEQRVRERTLALSAANEQLQHEIADRRRAEAEAEGANRAKSEFLSRMSHELRTPMNAILGFGQLLQMRAVQPRDRESVDQILRGGRHLLKLIDEVLDISRIEAGRLSLSPEPVQVGDAVRGVLDLARPLAAARQIECYADGPMLAERYVLADSQRLQQVLLNLISNGIKYNRVGGQVTVTCHAEAGGRLRISIIDTGAGIPMALRGRLFAPFDRLGAEAAGVEGTGLGLALSKRLVEAMGGRIGVESIEGQGSTFWVELPETAAPEHRLGLDPAGTPAAVDAARLRGTVLYVEDNPSNLRLVERVLADHSAIRLVPAMQGRLGLALAREHRPDLILADLHLPDMSGEDVLLEVQSDPDLKHTPVVIVSADATAGQARRLLAAGARAYLTKPLDVRQLLTLIDEELSTRQKLVGGRGPVSVAGGSSAPHPR